MPLVNLLNTSRLEAFVGPVINYGTAGKASDKVEVGKVYSVNEFIQRDMDAVSMGFEKYETPFGNYALNVTNDPNGVSCGTGDSFYSYEDTVIAVQADFDIVDMEAYASGKCLPDLWYTFSMLQVYIR